MENGTTSKRSRNIIILLLILLTASIGVNIRMFNEKDKVVYEKKEVTDRLDSVVYLKAELDWELRDANRELDQYKGMSAELDSMLSVARRQIEQQRRKITSLASQGEKNGAEMAVLRSQLEDFRRQRAAYLDRIDSLIQVNELLKEEKKGLETEIKTLSDKVSIASVLNATNITAKAMKRKAGGKLTETVLARKVEDIEVCSDIGENKVADKGQKQVYLRIISPEGVTLAVQDLGSGTFTNLDNKEESQYTTKRAMEYEGGVKNVCLNWQQDTPWRNGKYTVEVYVDGHLAGVSAFILK